LLLWEEAHKPEADDRGILVRTRKLKPEGASVSLSGRTKGRHGNICPASQNLLPLVGKQKHKNK